jgi:hypothetical protein
LDGQASQKIVVSGWSNILSLNWESDGNASDLARFGIEIQKSREGRSNRVLTQASVNTMLTREKDDDGLGFFLEGEGKAARFGHKGADEGFQALFLCTMQGGKAIVAMANADNSIRLAQEIAYSVAAEYGWPDYHPQERAAIFAGQYRSGDGTMLKIVSAQDHLLLTISSGCTVIGAALECCPGSEVELYPRNQNTFFSLEKGMPDVRFSETARGAPELSSGEEFRATKTK